MHITSHMIDPELRKAYSLRQWAVKNQTPLTFRLNHIMIKLLFIGRHSRAMRVEEVSVPRADGTMLRLCLYRPHTLKKGVPALLWIHGGGFAMGCPEQEESLIAQFVNTTGCFVVSPDYRLSIDAPYPAALDDCYLALRWLRDHAEENGARQDQLFVAGGSGGGGLTAALTLYARDKGEIAVAFQMPWYPMIDDRMITPSSAGDDAFWTARSNEHAWKLYLGELYGKEDVPVYAAPARATDLSGLPPTCTFIGSVETFCDETVAYVERLRQCGVPVDFRLYDGCFHSFHFAVPKASKSQDAIRFYLERFAYAAGNLFAPQPEEHA